MHVEALPWAVGQQRFTRALLVTIATWTRVLPWQQVATLFGCAWGTVERAVEAAVVYGLAHRDLTGVTHIGIDEISRKKGHVYVTNVYDLTRKRLLWSGAGRSQATLDGNGIRFRNWCIRLADQLEEALAHQTVAAGASSFFR